MKFIALLLKVLVFVVLYGSQAVLASPGAAELVQAARERTLHTVRYDGGYRRIAYPMGDVPDNIGVCTDVVIRAYRKLGIDLQKLIHQDIKSNFKHYPKIWGLQRPDRNIDHRRVPNMETFFARFGQTLPISDKGQDYQAGDLVSWRLPGNLPHIGIVSDRRLEGRPMIIHNIGAGPKEEDMLFHYPINGHYRYLPE